MTTLSLGRSGRSYTAASLRKQYRDQIAELPDKIADKPHWTELYMSEVEVLRGRGDALADIESEFDGIEVYAVKETMTATQLLLLKYDVVAEMLADVAADLAAGGIRAEYHKGRYQTVRDVWKHLRRDPYFPGNDG